MSIVDRALWAMERNSEQALGLNDIADACGVSRSHLANAFGTATGWPVMKYLRARRLTEAARRLAGGASDILTVALDHGYGSHEAFTRAFRDQFGLSPEQVCGRGKLDSLATTPPLHLRKANALPPSPQFKSLGSLKLVGLARLARSASLFTYRRGGSGSCRPTMTTSRTSSKECRSACASRPTTMAASGTSARLR